MPLREVAPKSFSQQQVPHCQERASSSHRRAGASFSHISNVTAVLEPHLQSVRSRPAGQRRQSLFNTTSVTEAAGAVAYKMTDLTPTFNELLKQREAPPTKRSFNIDNINEFLKEAYRIVRSAPASSVLLSRPLTLTLPPSQP